MELTFRIEGAQEMARVMRELGPRVANAAGDKALRAGSEPIVRRAKETAPKRTGTYAKNIAARLDTRLNRRGTGARRIHIGVLRPHNRLLHLLEFGTAHSSPRPHFRPAMDLESQNALDEIARVLKETIPVECKSLVR